MYYYDAKRKALFIKDGDTYVNVGVTVQEKRREIVEITGVSVKRGSVKVAKFEQSPQPLTLDEVLRKFNISEAKPLLTIQKNKKETEAQK